MKDKALKLALDELENCADLLKMFNAPIDSCVGFTMLQAEEAITAIKQALEQPVQEPVAWYDREMDSAYTESEIGSGNTDGLEPLYTTPPAQEIVCSTGLCHYRNPQPAPVQDIGVEQDERVFARIEARKNRDAAHKETAQRQWVGLTDDAKLDLISDAKGIGGRVQSDAQLFVLLDMQEAKLKELNT